MLLASVTVTVICTVQIKADSPSTGILDELEESMVLVERGTFTMGCTTEQNSCDTDEFPLRHVTASTFEISKYEVTQALWQEVMGDQPSTFKSCLTCPVETVSWFDVQQFISKLNGDEGNYRLPSEAEWEFAARGGNKTRGFEYAGSDDWNEVAWYYANSDNRTNPVGQKLANELGLYDMSGNVREWVQDCRHDTYVGAPAVTIAWQEGNCDRRSIRGGSWYGKQSYLRTTNRFWYGPKFRNNNLGFRLARSVVDQ